MVQCLFFRAYRHKDYNIYPYQKERRVERKVKKIYMYIYIFYQVDIKKTIISSCIFRIKFIQVSGVIFDART